MTPKLKIARKQGMGAGVERVQPEEQAPVPTPPKVSTSSTTQQRQPRVAPGGQKGTSQQGGNTTHPKRRRLTIAAGQGVSPPYPRVHSTAGNISPAREPSQLAAWQFSHPVGTEAPTQPISSSSRTALAPSFRPKIQIKRPIHVPQPETSRTTPQPIQRQSEAEEMGIVEQDFVEEDEFGPSQKELWGMLGGEEEVYEQWAKEYGGIVSDEVAHLADGENEMADYIRAIIENPDVVGELGIDDIEVHHEPRNETDGGDGQEEDEEERRRIEQLGKIPGPTILHHYAPNPALDINSSIVVNAPEGTVPSAFFQAVPIDSGVRLSSKFLAEADQCDVPYVAAPHGFEQQRLLSLSARLASARSISGQVVKTTLSNYGLGIKEFISFCEDNRVPPSKRFPCSGAIFMSFLRSVVGTGSESKVKKRADSLRFLYHIHDLGLPNFAELRRDLMRQAKMAQPKPREPRRPVLVEDLVAGIRNLEKESAREPSRRNVNVALKAAWLLATWGMLRSGEVCTRVMKQRADGTGFNPEINLHGGCFTYVAETDGFPEHYAVLLPWTKVEGREPVTIRVCGQASIEDGYLDPIAAITEHFSLNKPQPGEPAFAYDGDEGTRRWLSTSWFEERWSAALADEGRKGFKGHSFRIGGASIYTKGGKDWTWIKNAGRWKSNSAFELYIRSQLSEASKHLADITEEEYRPSKKGKNRPTDVEVEEENEEE